MAAPIGNQHAVPKTPEQRADRVRAGAAGAAKRYGITAEAPEYAKTGEQLPKDKPATLQDYDRLLGRPVSWTDAIKREQVQGEIIANEERADEARQRRGKLFTREQVEAREREYDEIVMAALSRLPEFASSLVTADQKEDARKKGRALISEIRTAVADETKKRRA